MQLRFLENDTPLQLRPEVYTPENSVLFDVLFHELATLNSFWVRSEELYNNFFSVEENTRYGITFVVDKRPYRLAGELKYVRLEDHYHLTLIEQVSPIEMVSRRANFRHEMRLDVNVYAIDPEHLNGEFPLTALEKLEFSCEMLDRSAGGVCLVSNEIFISPAEPYFLLEFALRGKEYFLLPARLVRKGQCPQSPLFKHDYGFDFIFGKFPDEKHRLSDAIFRAKLDKL
jgi:hypothetical protein